MSAESIFYWGVAFGLLWGAVIAWAVAWRSRHSRTIGG